MIQAVGEVSDVLVQTDKLKEQRSIAEALVKRSNETVKMRKLYLNIVKRLTLKC